jgi:hypothetical protein
MAKLESTKTLTTKAKIHPKGVNGADAAPGEEPELPTQRKRADEGQFCLQVDRQTKACYPTYEDAERAALAIKKGHPVVRVAVYDTVERVSKVIEVP